MPLEDIQIESSSIEQRKNPQSQRYSNNKKERKNCESLCQKMAFPSVVFSMLIMTVSFAKHTCTTIGYELFVSRSQQKEKKAKRIHGGRYGCYNSEQIPKTSTFPKKKN